MFLFFSGSLAQHYALQSSLWQFHIFTRANVVRNMFSTQSSTKTRKDLLVVALIMDEFLLLSVMCFLPQAETLAKTGSLAADEKWPYWFLRTSREEAVKRANAFFPKGQKPPPDTLVTLEIEFTQDGVASLWPDVLSVEPGSDPYRFRLNAKLYLKLVTPKCEPLYTVHMQSVTC